MNEAYMSQRSNSVDRLAAEFEALGGRMELLDGRLVIDAAKFTGAPAMIDRLYSLQRVLRARLMVGSPRPAIRSFDGPRSDAEIRSKLSVSQRRWVDEDLRTPEDEWIPIVWRIRGALDGMVFLQAYREVVLAHDILRSRVVRAGATPELRVHETFPDLERTDFSRAGPDAELQLWDRLKNSYDDLPGPEHGLVRLGLYLVGREEHLLAGFVHHIAFDGRSVRLFLGELMGRYHALRAGYVVPERARLQFADYVRWERTWLDDAGVENADAMWEYVLADVSPTRLAEGLVAPSPMEVMPFAMSKQLTSDARAFVREQKLSMSGFFLGCLVAQLTQLMRRRELIIGIYVHGRPAGFDDVIGGFAQIRPLLIAQNNTLSAREYFKVVRLALARAGDFRAPASPSLERQYEYPRVLVNYSLDPQLTDAPPGARRHRRPEERLQLAERGGLVSAPRPWKAHDATNVEVAAEMSRLPKPLQTRISRDLHFTVYESANALRGQATFSRNNWSVVRADSLLRSVAKLIKRVSASPDSNFSGLISADA